MQTGPFGYHERLAPFPSIHRRSIAMSPPSRKKTTTKKPSESPRRKKTTTKKATTKTVVTSGRRKKTTTKTPKKKVVKRKTAPKKKVVKRKTAPKKRVVKRKTAPKKASKSQQALLSAYLKAIANQYKGSPSKGRKGRAIASVRRDVKKTKNVTADHKLWKSAPTKYDLKGVDTRRGYKAIEPQVLKALAGL